MAINCVNPKPDPHDPERRDVLAHEHPYLTLPPRNLALFQHPFHCHNSRPEPLSLSLTLSHQSTIIHLSVPGRPRLVSAPTPRSIICCQARAQTSEASPSGPPLHHNINSAQLNLGPEACHLTDPLTRSLSLSPTHTHSLSPGVQLPRWPYHLFRCRQLRAMSSTALRPEAECGHWHPHSLILTAINDTCSWPGYRPTRQPQATEPSRIAR